VKELDAVGWAIRLAKRLEALHALGVAHGSVSPACILASSVERTAQAYLADAKLTASNPAFQSPERILGGDLSTADDTWAVAATLYAVLTGKGPFAAANEAETRQKILAAQPPPLTSHDVGDDDLQHILDHAFARELSARTTAVATLRQALEEWHPDPSVGALLPLDDEASAAAGDALDNAPTVMRPSSAIVPKVAADDEDDERVATQKPSPPEMPPPASAEPRLASPRAMPPPAPAAPDTDDDDKIRTAERDIPKPISTDNETSGEITLEIIPAPVKPKIAAFPAPAAPGLRPRTPAVSPWLANPMPGPILAPAPRRSNLGMVLAAVLAVLVAAALTFAFMRYRIGG